MFQDYLLFPHLSAMENVAFGLRAKGTDKKTARDRATQALARLGLEGPWSRPARARCPAASSSAWPWPRPGDRAQAAASRRAPAALDLSTKTYVRRLLREALRQSEAANVLVTTTCSTPWRSATGWS